MSELDIAELIGYALGAFALGYGVGMFFRSIKQFIEQV